MDQNSEIARFGQDVEAMTPLREELGRIGTDLAAIVQFANSKGYNFTLADVQRLIPGAKLTDAQLGEVSGGMTFNHMGTAVPRSVWNLFSGGSMSGGSSESIPTAR